jgi:hypothetical protein
MRKSIASGSEIHCATRKLSRNHHVGDYSREASGNRIGTATWT